MPVEEQDIVLTLWGILNYSQLNVAASHLGHVCLAPPYGPSGPWFSLRTPFPVEQGCLPYQPLPSFTRDSLSGVSLETWTDGTETAKPDCMFSGLLSDL